VQLLLNGYTDTNETIHSCCIVHEELFQGR